MSKIFRPNNKESILLSKIESSKERERRFAIRNVRENMDVLANKVSMKLIEADLIETTSKNSLQAQFLKKMEELCNADDFDIDYQIAPFREMVPHPNVVSLYLTAFVLETLINHKDIIDIYGTDDEIYHCIHKQIIKKPTE
jgi:hypothetical protein